jgi:hypothetical protein
MTFTYTDLMFYLEERELLPAEYFEIETALEAHSYLATWLGYETMDEYEGFELDVELRTDTHGTWERYATTSTQNEPPKLAKEIYTNFINSCVDHANWM